MKFCEKVKEALPEKGTVCLFWLGQAGFVLKNSYQEVLAIDPYLSDLSERLDGNKRLMMSVVEPEDLKADIVLASHCHTDHLDLDSLPVILKDSELLLCDSQSAKMCEDAHIEKNKVRTIKEGEKLEFKHFVIEAVFCDHGDAATEALGFVIETDGVKIYFAGDSSFQPERMKTACNKDIDILLVPINGEYGNMNERDAVMLAGEVKPRLTIPCHFWTFARHKGNPYEFELEMKVQHPELKYYIMCQGEKIEYKK